MSRRTATHRQEGNTSSLPLFKLPFLIKPVGFIRLFYLVGKYDAIFLACAVSLCESDLMICSSRADILNKEDRKTDISMK